MRAIVRHPNRGITLLLLDCGCWVETADAALEWFAQEHQLTPEDVAGRIQAQHEHQEPPRSLRVDLERRFEPDPDEHGVWPLTDRRRPRDRRVSLSVGRGQPVPLVPCAPEHRS